LALLILSNPLVLLLVPLWPSAPSVLSLVPLTLLVVVLSDPLVLLPLLLFLSDLLSLSYPALGKVLSFLLGLLSVPHLRESLFSSFRGFFCNLLLGFYGFDFP
jgi:hypothetical protein